MASGTELATAYVQIVPSADGIKAGIEKELDPEFESAGKSGGEKFSSKFLTTAKVALAAGGAALAKVVSSAISEGADLEQSLGGIETLFKDSADTMKEYAYAAYETAGISANDYMEQATSFAASLLSSLDGDTAAAADSANQAIIDMADNANKMGTNIEDIQNAYQGFAKQNYTMLDNLKLGYGGTKTEMERLLADAEEMSGVEYDIDNLSDVYEAIHVIQESLDITGTTSKEAATTLSGSFASMKAAASNLLGNMAIGEDITPQLEQLISTTKTYLVDNLLPAIGNVLSSLPQAFTTLGSAGVEIAASLVNGLSDGISEIPDIADTVLSSLVSNIANFAGSIDLAGATTGLIDSVFPMLAQLSETIRTNAGQLVDVGLDLLLQLAQGIANGLPTLITYLPTIVTNIAGIINDTAPKILTTGVKILGTLANGIIQAIPTLVANIPQIITAIVSVFMAYNWVNLGGNIITFIKNGIKSLSKSIPTAIKNIGNTAKEWFSAINWTTLGSDVIDLIQIGLQSLASAIPGALQTIATTAIGWFKSVDWIALGTSVIGLIQSGVITLSEIIPEKLQEIATAAIEWFKSVDWIALGSDVIDLIKSGVETLVTKIPEKLQEIATTAAEWFSDIDWLEVGTDVVNGIISGIEGALGSLWSTATELCDGLLGTVKDFFGISSPSTVMESQGSYLVDGLINGIDGLPAELDGYLSETLSSVSSWGEDISNSAMEAASDFLNHMTKYFSQMPGNIQSYTKKVLANIKSWGMSIAATGKSAGNSFLNSVLNGVKSIQSRFSPYLNSVKSTVSGWGSSLSSSFKNIGKNVIQGLINGMSSMVSSLYSSIKASLSGLVSTAKSALGINSPSKVFRDEIGLMMGYGMAEGLEDSYKTVQRAVNGLANTSVKDIRSKIDVISEIESSGFLKRPAMAAAAAGNTTNTTIINGITYDDGSNIADTVSALMRAARIERRS